MSELVTAYMDGALPWATRVKARLHLFMCHACRRYFDQMRQTARFLSRAPHAAPPPETERQLLDAIAAAHDGHGHGNPS
jgi:predicted anti-sigma-YlaC factor YlaD